MGRPASAPSVASLVVSVFAIFASACPSTTPTSAGPPPLDVPLRAGQTRAGVIRAESELVGGPTAKGRIGDYKIYNDRIAVVLGAPGTSRGFQPYGGTILDADRVRPVGQPGGSLFGEVVVGLDLATVNAKRAEIVSDGSSGGAARIRFFGERDVVPLFDQLFSELAQPTVLDLDWTVDYVLEPGSEVLRIEHTIRNRGKPEVRVDLPLAGFIFGDGALPFMPGYGFTPPTDRGGGDYFGAIGPDVSYLYGRAEAGVSVILTQSGIVVASLGDGFSLRGGASTTITHQLVIGDGDLARSQAAWRRVSGLPPWPQVDGRVETAEGRPVAGARVHAVIAETPDEDPVYVSMARTDAQGRFALGLAPGRYFLRVAADGHRVGEAERIEVAESRSLTGRVLRVGATGRILYEVTDDRGRGLPVKLSIRPEGGEVRALPARYGEPVQGYGLLTTVFGITGRGAVSLPPGGYRVFTSRGPEYEIDERLVTVDAGGDAPMVARLTRSVTTAGWLASDTHVHAQLSPDSPDLYPLKVSAMVSEGLEIPVSTEHEAIGDFNPAIRALGLEDWIQGIVGTEVTTYIYGHFNAFPLLADASKPGNGRIEWYRKTPAEIFATIRAAPGDPFVQVNHPRALAIGGYFSAMGFDASAFTFARSDLASLDFDGMEVASGCDVETIEERLMPDWFAFLNHGHRVRGTGSTDNHRASDGAMGLPRTYVRSPTDEPRAVTVDAVRAAFKTGRLVVSCGPFVEIRVGNAEVGDTAPVSDGKARVEVRVAAPTWMDVDAIDFVVNGAEVSEVSVPASSAVARLSSVVEVPVPVGRDAWLIARVRGDRPHGVWARDRSSYAFTNPIFIDGDGDGVWSMR